MARASILMPSWFVPDIPDLHLREIFVDAGLEEKALKAGPPEKVKAVALERRKCGLKVAL